MLKVEMTGRLFRVAEALTAAGIQFNIKNAETADIWVLEIKPPFGGKTWTIGELPENNYVSVRDEKFDMFVIDIRDEDDPVERLADAAAYSLIRDRDKMSDTAANKVWSSNPVWLQAFLKYGIVKATVVTTYNYVTESDRRPLPAKGDSVLLSDINVTGKIRIIDSTQKMVDVESGKIGENYKTFPIHLDRFWQWNKESRQWIVTAKGKPAN